jgi:predicted ATP-grasp superfamily ATP-dependent carboligase
MTDETGMMKSEIQTVAETAVKIDRLLTQAKDMAIKLKATSEALNRMVEEGDDNASGE